MEYTLKLIKVSGLTYWAVHDGRKVVGKPFDTYTQASAARARLELTDDRPTPRVG